MVGAPYGAVILAGGAGRRLGGVDKPGRTVRGRSLLDRVLDAVATAAPRVVVGPPRPGLPHDVLTVREDPPGAGPVAALAAGLACATASRPDTRDCAPSPGRAGGPDRTGSPDRVDPPERVERPERVALLAADLPYLTADAVLVLLERLEATGADGAVYVDAGGRPQWLCGAWRTAALLRRIADLGPLVGLPVRTLVAGLTVVEVRTSGGGAPPPWFDCDTHDDLRRAREWPS